MGLGGQRHASAALPPPSPVNPGTHYRRLGGPQGRYGRVRKISPTPGFDPRTVKPVASHLSYSGRIIYVVRQLSSRTRHRVRAVAALDKSLSIV